MALSFLDFVNSASEWTRYEIDVGPNILASEGGGNANWSRLSHIKLTD